MTRIAISGATGLIGSAVAASLRADGHEVVRLVRRQSRSAAGALPPGETASPWDPGSPDGGLDAESLAGVTAVIHLAGAGIADKRWTPERKAEIRDSRVGGTQALATGLARLPRPPGALLCGSAVGWYGDTGSREVDESAPAGSGFLAGLVREWEAAAEPARAAGIRTAHLRTGIVLTAGGGTLKKMLPVFRLGLGVRLGTGRQYLSWITLADEVSAIRFLLDRPDLSGPVNLTAPGPVTNAGFTEALNEALGRPGLLRLPGLRLPGWMPGAPAQALSLALGEVAGELLASARVLPRRLLEAGYAFRHPEVSGALVWALGQGGS